MQQPLLRMQPFAELVSSTFGSQFRIASIDPGSDTLGFTLLIVDMRTGVITVEHSETYHASRNLRYLPDGYEELNGSMRARMFCHQKTLTNLLCQFQPHVVVAESAFLKKRFPRSFEVLTIGLEMIRSALYFYDPSARLDLVDPRTVKKAVGVTTNLSDKEKVHQGVINYPGLQWNVDPHTLDEHSSDSVAIGLYRASLFKSEYLCPANG